MVGYGASTRRLGQGRRVDSVDGAKVKPRVATPFDSGRPLGAARASSPRLELRALTRKVVQMLPKLSMPRWRSRSSFRIRRRRASDGPGFCRRSRPPRRAFQDVKQAIAEGYVRDPMDMCDTAEMMGKPASLGGMGVHYFRPGLLGIKGPPEAARERQRDPYRLPAAQRPDLRAPARWDAAAGGRRKPRVPLGLAGGREHAAAAFPWHRLRPDAGRHPRTKVDEARMFEPHYDRHVWIFRDNPNGMFAQFNPKVSCSAHQASVAKSASARPRSWIRNRSPTARSGWLPGMPRRRDLRRNRPRSP